jgi:DNA repair exonuclease SbcCD ATPase subunit
MSNAQKSMISMVLSFSILHQSSSRYNVIKLDEIDGSLDTNNRAYFLELLNKIMYMMNCEQCFMISHNNELDTSSCDIILLKSNANEIPNGNIIWQY